MEKNRIAENLEIVRNEIFAAEEKSGRKKGSVKLCAVSKFHSAEEVRAALNEGQVLFGENRVQEAYAKFGPAENSLRGKTKLHIIGSLQTNKVKKAVEIADCIQSVDRENLLAEIERQCTKLNRKIEIYFEIHTGEDSKSGYVSRDDFFVSLENFEKGLYPHLVPRGLMTMAPFTADEFLVRKSFSSLRNLRDESAKKFPSAELTELSMGMSGDFKIAIEEGSTMVRIGTAIFGERIPS